jgi:hypothetical protein
LVCGDDEGLETTGGLVSVIEQEHLIMIWTWTWLLNEDDEEEMKMNRAQQ